MMPAPLDAWCWCSLLQFVEQTELEASVLHRCVRPRGSQPAAAIYNQRQKQAMGVASSLRVAYAPPAARCDASRVSACCAGFDEPRNVRLRIGKSLRLDEAQICLSPTSSSEDGTSIACSPCLQLSLGPISEKRDLSPEAMGPHSPVGSGECRHHAQSMHVNALAFVRARPRTCFAASVLLPWAPSGSCAASVCVRMRTCCAGPMPMIRRPGPTRA
jgi:hypothetical protein